MFARRRLLAIGCLAATVLCVSPALAGGWGFGVGFSYGGRGHYSVAGYGRVGCYDAFTTYCEPSVAYYDPAPVVYDPDPIVYRDYVPPVVYRDYTPRVVYYGRPRSVYVSGGYHGYWPARAVTYSYRPAYSHRPAYSYRHAYPSPRYYAGPRYHYGGHRSYGGSFYYRGGHGRSYGGSVRWHR